MASPILLNMLNICIVIYNKMLIYKKIINNNKDDLHYYLQFSAHI
jgi:hypothetical protein